MGFCCVGLRYGVMSWGRVSGSRQPQGKVRVKVKVSGTSRFEGGEVLDVLA